RAEHSALHEIRSQRTRRRARGGILIKFPGHHPASKSGCAIAQREAIRECALLADQPRQFRHVHFDSCQSRAVPQRHHQVENTGGYEFRRELWIEVLGMETKSGGKFFLIHLRGLEDGFFLRHRHALRSPVLEADFHRKNARARLLKHVHTAFLRGDDAQLRKQKPRSDYGMAGQLELFLGGEDAQTRQRAIVGGLLHKNRLREVHLTGDGQHLILRKTVAIGDDGQGIALKARGGENVHGEEAMIHMCSVSIADRAATSNPRELADGPFAANVHGVPHALRRKFHAMASRDFELPQPWLAGLSAWFPRCLFRNKSAADSPCRKRAPAPIQYRPDRPLFHPGIPAARPAIRVSAAICRWKNRRWPSLFAGGSRPDRCGHSGIRQIPRAARQAVPPTIYRARP